MHFCGVYDRPFLRQRTASQALNWVLKVGTVPHFRSDCPQFQGGLSPLWAGVKPKPYIGITPNPI